MAQVTELRLSNKDFSELSSYIYNELGIKMPDVKKVMLESRLQRRLRKLQIHSFQEYIAYLFSPEGKEHEIRFFIDEVTTNKTDFFREPAHFDHLTSSVLPELATTSGAGVKRPLRIWSAGCSTGEEPYTMSMVLHEYKSKVPNFMFSILATDISLKVLEHAYKGVYKEELIANIPLTTRKKYFLKSKNKTSQLVKVTKELQYPIQFGKLNFMDHHFGLKNLQDIIFCRNVIIYFDKETQRKLLRKFCDNLVKGGYLFLGHSETLQGLDIPLEPVAPTVYRHI